MTARFDRAIGYTLHHEGRYVDDPDDPGMATNFGISLRFLLSRGEIERFDYDGDGDLDADDVRAMSLEQASEVYRQSFWLPWFEDLSSEALAIKVFDFGVNMGPLQCGKLLQRSYNEMVPASARLYVDGKLGPISQQALSMLSADSERILISDLEDHAARFYYALAEKRAASRKYLFGWLRRAYSRPGA